MNRFKWYWIVVCSVILLGGITLAFWYHCAYPKDIANLINMGLAIIAAFSSFVAIMIADQKLRAIKTNLGIWSPSNEIVDKDKEMVVFKLTNKSKKVIDDLIILLNIPKELELHFGGGYNTSTADYHHQANTTILTFKQFEYLDSSGEHSNIEIRLGLKLDNWSNARVIYLSVLGQNMISQRFKVTSTHVSGIRKANSATPFKIEAIT